MQLSTIGGNDLHESVNGIMAHLFTQNLLCLYNWSGKQSHVPKEKKQFSYLPINRVIVMVRILTSNKPNYVTLQYILYTLNY